MKRNSGVNWRTRQLDAGVVIVAEIESKRGLLRKMTMLTGEQVYSTSSAILGRHVGRMHLELQEFSRDHSASRTAKKD